MGFDLTARAVILRAMRSVIAICIALCVVLSPVVSTVAGAIGSGDTHATMDRIWHGSEAEVASAHDEGHATAQDADGDCAESSQCHAHHIHLSIYVASPSVGVHSPTLIRDRVYQPVTFPRHRVPHPPLRPPQAA